MTRGVRQALAELTAWHAQESSSDRPSPAPLEQPPPVLRALGFWATIVQLVGYTTGLVFIHHTTGMTPPGVAVSIAVRIPRRHRGGDEVPQALRRNAQHHTHAPAEHGGDLRRSVALALALCERPGPRWRQILSSSRSCALLVSFSSMWLMRYVDARFSWLLSLSSGLMALTFYVQSWFILRELAGLRGTA